jgi:hypothetical protein
MIATGILKTYALMKNEKFGFAWNSHPNKSCTLTTHINSIVMTYKIRVFFEGVEKEVLSSI